MCQEVVKAVRVKLREETTLARYNAKTMRNSARLGVHIDACRGVAGTQCTS
jgi:hypothetical protein